MNNSIKVMALLALAAGIWYAAGRIAWAIAGDSFYGMSLALTFGAILMLVAEILYSLKPRDKTTKRKTTKPKNWRTTHENN